MATTLSRKQIMDLAIYAGFKIQDITDEDFSTEFVISTGTITDDTDPEYNGRLAFRSDYPDEGAIPLD